MNKLFICPKTHLLRSGWRALIFFALSPLILLVISRFLPKMGSGSEMGLKLDAATILAYVFQVAWMLFLSWILLKYLEHLPFPAVGFPFTQGWAKEIAAGLGIAIVMIAAVVAIQIATGGTELSFNPEVKTKLGAVSKDLVVGLIFFTLAGAFEELLFRGYAFQTVIRAGNSPLIPILFLSAGFGLVHLGNPGATFFAIANTILAGLWLSVGFLKTRRLWFCTGLHFGWNWAMGLVFGLPVSGIHFGSHPLLISTSGPPVWATGGGYGCEGGVAATIVLFFATLVIWKAPLFARPEREEATSTGA